MNILTDFEELKRLTRLSFQFQQHKEADKKIVGILFAQPNSFTQGEILTGIDYFHNRSNEIIDFFCAGYQPSFFDDSLKVSAIVGGESWSFNPKIFNQIRKETEKTTNWKYSGSVELILFNAKKSNDTVELDFSDSICIDLLKAKNEGLINSVGELFEEIFRLSETIDPINPSKNLSLKLIGQTGEKSLVPILFKLLPKQIQDHSKKIYLFGTEIF